MKLQFKEQQYQVDAVNAIANVFNNCEINHKDSDFYKNPKLWTLANEKLIKENIYSIQKNNAIPEKYHCKPITNRVSPRQDMESFDYSLFLDVTMETGTGKTFTFIETMYKLRAEQGIAKFIILVPSVAIKQGTIKNLEITKEYFQQKYSNQKLDIFAYRSASAKGKKIASVPAIESFIANDNKNISVLIMTRQAFANEGKNLIYLRRDTTLYNGSSSYMDAIAAQNPVLIIDEPHRFKSDKTIDLLKNFNAQFVLRYGATFGEKGKEGFKNLLYILDSVDAFRHNLVKRIEVTTIENADITNSEITLLPSSTRDKACVRYCTQDGKIKEVSLLKNDDLSDKTKDSRYTGYILENIVSIDGQKQAIFSNGFTLQENVTDSISRQKEAEKEMLLKTTIDYHFNRERELFDQGIKTLSLIFIDGVRQYRGKDGKAGELAELFEKLYKERLEDELRHLISDPYREHLLELKKDVKRVHAGYFSEDNQLSDDKIEKDIEIILRDKEKLLDINEPRRFIFSMWALQEGWDNPNVFTLCKLAPSNSSVTKLQQIGRGLRLAVNKYGERITDSHNHFNTINMLSVIVPGTEKNFVLEIQNDVALGSIQNGYHILTAEILKNKGIVDSNKKAVILLSKLEEIGILAEDPKDEDSPIIQENIDLSLIDTLDDTVLPSDKKALLKQLLVSSNMLNSKITNKRSTDQKVYINKENYKKFEELWKLLNQKVYYEFDIDSKALVEKVLKMLSKEKQYIQTQDFNAFKLVRESLNRDNTLESPSSSTRISSVGTIRKYSIKEVIHDIQKQTKLSLSSIIIIISKLDKDIFTCLVKDPRQVKQYIIHFIKEAKIEMILQKIEYSFAERKSINTVLTKNGSVVDYITLGDLGRAELTDFPKDTCLYENLIGYDSEIEEKTIKESNVKSIQVYAKLPRIKIPLPFGTFSPDFAYILNKTDSKSLYLIVETKGYDTMYTDNLSETERRKIYFTEQFIESIRKTQDIPIYFKTKINKKELSAIIAELKQPLG